MIARCNLCVGVPPEQDADGYDGIFRVPWDPAGIGMMAEHLRKEHGIAKRNVLDLSREGKAVTT